MVPILLAASLAGAAFTNSLQPQDDETGIDLKVWWHTFGPGGTGPSPDDNHDQDGQALTIADGPNMQASVLIQYDPSSLPARVEVLGELRLQGEIEGL